jgi:putative Ca2+/H+ antiporter (TMEM165/GDT1 family)
LTSGSELQLRLERRTYLISVLLAYSFAFELASLFLFIYTVDHLHTLFVGAMCAAGTLYVNGYGYPALILKVVNFLLAGLWLILNYADNKADDYPLVKKKYLFLLGIAPFLLIEGISQWNYFLRLNPDVITSCCGSLFSTGTETLASEIASLPSIPMKVVFYLSVASTVGTGFYFCLKNRGGYFFASLSATALFLSILSILSFISLYYYELPTHHCPFCILQREYGYVGYPLYVALLGGGVSGMGVGLLMPFRKIGSLSETLPSLQKKLAFVSSILFTIFAVMVTLRMIFSDFILEGY